MEAIQRQMLELNYKVDQLYGIIEVLSSQVDTLIDNRPNNRSNNKPQKTVASRDQKPQNLDIRKINHLSKPPQSSLIKHKDVLDDYIEESFEKPHLEELLSPDVQIQRLTAQLTAAYHRIATLEEQLLSQRERI